MDKAVVDEFTTFVRERSHALMGTAYALCGNQHDAEDLVQNALAKGYVHWTRIESTPEAYVRRIMYRDFVSAWRWRHRRPEVTVADVPQRHRGDDHGADTVNRMALVEALRELPPRQRAVLVLRYLEDMSERDAAETLGCSAGTIASQASRALAKLRHRLGTTPTDPIVGGHAHVGI